MIPQYLRPLFWDAKFEDLEPDSNPDYIIGRVLEYGDETAVAWLKQSFRAEEIKRVICSERRLTRKSANFWALAYGIPFREVAALTATR